LKQLSAKLMIEALRAAQRSTGATFDPTTSDEADGSAPLSFGNDAIALQAATDRVALYDRTHWGRIWVKGDDRIRYLHNQTTNNFNRLQAGHGCDTVFVTSTGRTIDLVSAYVLPDGVLLLTSPGYNQRLITWMDRFIFFADKVELEDQTAQLATFSLMGATSHALLEKLGAAELINQPAGNHAIAHVNGIETRIAIGSGLATAGYTLFVDRAGAATLWQTLFEAGAVPLGETAWQQLRIQQGRPMPDQELTEEFNPLEAGLWQTISLEKGCYIGQETIARLYTYRGVKQQLWGLRLTQNAEPGTVIQLGEEKIGKLTSCVATDQGYSGLGYIRTKAASAGLKVQIADAAGELIAVPFLTHDYPDTAIANSR
jgi:tRNA-modifying protein YgfZ